MFYNHLSAGYDLSVGYCYLPLTELGPDSWFLKSNYLTFDPKCRALGRLTNTGKTVLLEMCTHGLCHTYCCCTLPLSKWSGGHPTSRQKCCHKSLYPLHPNISMPILHSVLYTFPTVLTRRICLKIKSFLSWWWFCLFLWPWSLIQGWYYREKIDDGNY